MYDSPDDDPVRSSACSVGMNQSSQREHPRAWMRPYIEATANKDSWIVKHIMRDGFLDDVCRHPGVDKDRIKRMNQSFIAAGLNARIIYKDGGNALYLEKP